MNYKLLDKFEAMFVEGPYLHRNSTLGDAIALELYEDLLDLNRSAAYRSRVEAGLSVVNRANKRHGVVARRGDGSFGEIVPKVDAVGEAGYAVLRGPIATIEIGIEVKILAKAMIKQIDRVIHDLTGQVDHFKSQSGAPITVGVVGINHADYTVGYEGDRSYKTDGKAGKHPIQEAAEAERRLRDRAAPAFDEFIVLPYVARNEGPRPMPFKWLNAQATSLTYGAALARISTRYQQSFGT